MSSSWDSQRGDSRGWSDRSSWQWNNDARSYWGGYDGNGNESGHGSYGHREVPVSERDRGYHVEVAWFYFDSQLPTLQVTMTSRTNITGNIIVCFELVSLRFKLASHSVYNFK